MQTKTLEIWVGVFIAAGLAALFVLAMQVSNLTVLGDDGGYTVKARFENVSGLKVRSAVTVAGVRVGRVSAIEFDPMTFQALVSMRIGARYDELPIDTSASVLTSGLVGEKYVGLDPGGDMDVLKDGDEIMLTQSTLVLEQMIGKFLFDKAETGKGE